MAKTNGIEARKIIVGEIIEFEDFAVSNCETKFGLTGIYNFADKDGKVIRKCFEQGGLAKFLKENPEAKSVCLKKKLQDGEYTYNVWSLN